MRNKRLLRFLPLLLVISLLTSACWTIRFISVIPTALSPGEKGKVSLRLYPSVSDTSYGGYVFLLIGYDTAQLDLTGPRKFDNEGNFGGRFDRVKDNDLRDLILGPDGTCESNGISPADITGVTWVAYRTTEMVQALDGDVEDPFKINVFFTRQFASNTDSATLVIFSGLWQDIADQGTAGAGDTTLCGSLIFTGVGGTS